MAHINIEIKARCGDPDRIRRILSEHNAEFRGADHQTDTYFAVPRGRLKLRQGTIENALIFYHRPDEPGPKRAEVSLFVTSPTQAVQLHQTLAAALDKHVVVKKDRDIYFIENVKFHIDSVKDLGTFVEIEAIDEYNCIGAEKLRQQCEHYRHLFGIAEADLVHCSYCDLLLQKKHP